MLNIKLSVLICTKDEQLSEALQQVQPAEGYPFELLPVQAQLTEESAAGADVIICDMPLAEVPRLPHRQSDGAPRLIFVEHTPDEVEAAGRLEEFEDIWTMPLSAVRLAYLLRRTVRAGLIQREAAVTSNTFKLAVDSVPDLFWMKDMEGRHYNVNEAFCKLVQKSKEQCEGRGHYYIWDIEPDEYAKGEFVCLESEDTVVKERKTCFFKEKIIGPDGAKMQFHTYKTPIFDVDGTVIGTFGIARNVTNWKNQSTELSIIINSLSAAFIVGDNDKIVVANKAAAELFNQPLGELQGACYSEWRANKLNYGRSIAPGEVVRVDYEIDCCERNLEIYEEPILDVFNQRVGSFVRFVDVTEHMEHINLLMNYKKQLEADVTMKTKTIQEMQRKFLISFSDLVNSRDTSAGDHIKNTSRLVDVLLDQLRKNENLQQLQDPEYRNYIRRAVALHDIGKMSIPDTILNKQEEYTPQEREIRRGHARLGGRILARTLAHVEDFKYFQIAWNMAVYHHEAWDGSGYPQGLSGTDIPLEARIMATANFFDRLLKGRIGRKGYSLTDAFEIVRRVAGKRLDPMMAEALLAARPEIEGLLAER